MEKITIKQINKNGKQLWEGGELKPLLSQGYILENSELKDEIIDGEKASVTTYTLEKPKILKG